MGKNPRKRQKTSKDLYDSKFEKKRGNLDLLLDDSTKDDEERRLESLLFGTKYLPQKGKGKEIAEDDDEGIVGDGLTLDESRGLAHLLDKDLFFVDDGDDEITGSSPTTAQESGASDDEDEAGSGSEASNERDDSAEPPERTASPSGISQPSQSWIKSSKTRSAWADPADSNPDAGVSLLQGPARRRKLRQAVEEDVISAQQYETRLRSQFEAINPEPDWAKKARKVLKKGQGETTLDDEEDEDAAALTSTAGILKSTKTKGRTVLAKGEIQIERLRDVNQSVQKSGSGEVRVVSFHPGTAASILCVATADRRIRLFNVDGHLSPLLTTLHFPNLPMTSATSALFHPSGDSMLISGPRPFFYTYDLLSGTPTHHARGLWGTTFNGLNDTSATVQRRRKRGQDGELVAGSGDGEGLSLTSFSTDGDMLAVAGRGGYVHLVDWKTGAGQVVGSLKCSSTGSGAGAGGIKGMWWVPPGFSDSVLGDGVTNFEGGGSSKLAVLTGDSEVFIWDVGQRRCVKKWQDEGGFRGSSSVLAGTSAAGAGYIAVGSNTGYVNVYNSDAYSNLSMDASKPKPLKSIANLTTPISTARFNYDSQLLAIASKDKKDSMRLIHLPSLTAFSNWPTSGTPLGNVTGVDFSPRSEYVAIGNSKGRVLLYHLKDYGVW